MKPYEELTFADDFMFCKVLTEYPSLCKELLEIIIGKKVGDFVALDRQKPIEITANGKGVRFDVYIEDDTETIYDIEMQTTTQADLPKRCRYYQALLDLNTLQRGNKYRELKNSYIIFILLDDPFAEERSKYTFEYFCVEEPTLCLNDGTTKIFLNANSEADDVSSDLQSFLYYVAGNKASSVLTSELEKCVNDAKIHKKWRKEYMSLELKFQEIEDKGFKKAMREMATSLFEDNMNFDHVKRLIKGQLSDDEIRQIQQQVMRKSRIS